MDKWQYLAILAACVAITLPLEGLLGARVYRRPRAVAATLLPVVAVFGFWDVVASHRGHWWWSPDFVTGVSLLWLPLEEWLFFLAIPLCVLLTYEVLNRRPAQVRTPPTLRTEARPAVKRRDT
jgi:lycopene cyclase domain-containing protein